MRWSGRNRRTSDPDAPLRLMFYDRTCTGRFPWPGLTHAWSAGGVLYDALGRLDAWHGVATWAEGLDWLLSYSRPRPIAEIQFWGHGGWGGLWMEEHLIKIDVLQPGHALHDRLAALKYRLVSDGSALWWFRCCDTFGTKVGHDFARQWTRFFGCHAAGHTYHINFLQSGLHALAPGEEPYWPENEGVQAGLPHARESHWLAPHTITCLHGTIPRRSWR